MHKIISVNLVIFRFSMFVTQDLKWCYTSQNYTYIAIFGVPTFGTPNSVCHYKKHNYEMNAVHTTGQQSTEGQDIAAGILGSLLKECISITCSSGGLLRKML